VLETDDERRPLEDGREGDGALGGPDRRDDVRRLRTRAPGRLRLGRRCVCHKERDVRDLEGLRRIWLEPTSFPQYYPLVFTTFWLEYHLWGLDPFGFHVTNVLLHASSAVLLWLLLRRLGVPGAWLAAAIFALHPVEAESVAWVTERKNVLSGLFYLAAFHAYWSFADGEAPAHPASRRNRWAMYAASVLLFACALLAKTVTGSLPAALLLASCWKRGRVRAREVLALVPLVLVGVASGLNTAWMEKHVVGAQGTEWTLTFVERCCIAGRALWFYAAKIVWPYPLTFVYPRWHVDPSVWWQVLLPVAAVAVVVALWCLRRRIGRGPLAATLFFAGTLFPALGFFDFYPMRYSFVADHFQYLASIGLVTLLAALATRVAGRQREVGSVAAAVLLVTLGAFTWRQGAIYANLETLWRDTVAKNPDAALAHNNLGLILDGRDRVDEAVAHYREALRVKPDFVEAQSNMGLALIRLGRLDEAIVHLREAVRTDPGFADAHSHLGKALEAQGKIPEAMAEYAAAMAEYAERIRIAPTNAHAHFKLGNLLVAQGRADEAVAHYREALRIDPGSVVGHGNMGAVLMRLGRLEEAIAHLREAVRIDPGFADAHSHLANALEAQGKISEAIVEYSEAVRITPTDAQAHLSLANLLVAQGRADEAVAHYRGALLTRPDFVEAQSSMGAALIHLGRLDEAIGHLQEAVRIDPGFADAYFNLGIASDAQGNLAGAIAAYAAALEHRPNFASAQLGLGLVYARQGQDKQAVEAFHAALRMRPDWPEAETSLAWILATHPDATLRNGTEAVQLAERACQQTNHRNVGALDTLAAAYAEVGRFQEAVQTAESALQIAQSAGQPQLVQSIRAHADAYRLSRPVREKRAQGAS